MGYLPITNRKRKSIKVAKAPLKCKLVKLMVRKINNYVLFLNKFGLVLVSPIDNTRMDLVIPGEQHMYLRAATSQERQLWLVALGSAKACVQSRNRKDSSESVKCRFKKFFSLFCNFYLRIQTIIDYKISTILDFFKIS